MNCRQQHTQRQNRTRFWIQVGVADTPKKLEELFIRLDFAKANGLLAESEHVDIERYAQNKLDDMGFQAQFGPQTAIELARDHRVGVASCKI